MCCICYSVFEMFDVMFHIDVLEVLIRFRYAIFKLPALKPMPFIYKIFNYIVYL